MYNYIKILFVFILFYVVNTNFVFAGDDNKAQNFTRVEVEAYSKDRNKDVAVLNKWLENNPNQKVVSFSGILSYRDNVDAYIIYYIKGDNSKQRFTKIIRQHSEIWDESKKDGLQELQLWLKNHNSFKLIAFASVPAYSGGAKEYVILYQFE